MCVFQWCLADRIAKTYFRVFLDWLCLAFGCHGLELTNLSGSWDLVALLLQLIASSGNTIECGDIKIAFLSGDRDDREVFILPPPDVTEMFNMSEHETLRLHKAVYGLVNALRERWERLCHKSSLTLGFVQSRLHPCLFIVKSAGKIHGMLGIHADDLLGGGDRVYQAAITKLRK